MQPLVPSCVYSYSYSYSTLLRSTLHHYHLQCSLPTLSHHTTFYDHYLHTISYLR